MTEETKTPDLVYITLPDPDTPTLVIVTGDAVQRIVLTERQLLGLNIEIAHALMRRLPS